jgi:hypothetical protein
MNNKIQSQFCVEISSVVHAAGREITQNIFATDLYVYVEVAGRQIIFIPEKETQYLINTDQERLIKADVLAQTTQFLQMKQLIGELSFEEEPIEQGRHVHITNINQSIVSIEAEIETIEFTGLEQTVLSKYEEFQSALRPVSIKLKTNEIVSSLNTTLIVNGRTNESNMKLLEIKKSEIPCQHDRYFYFQLGE